MSDLDLTEKMIKKIKSKIDKIRKTVDLQGRYAYYLITDDEVKLVNKGHKQSTTKKDFYEKIKNKSKYINNDVYEVELIIDEKYIEKQSSVVAGPVSLHIKQYIINDDFKLVHKYEHKNGAVWYTNADLLEDGFHFNDIKKIIKDIDTRNINILSIGGVRALKILNGH